MQRLAEEGRTVFLSSHLMSEMELTADRLIVIGRGRLIAETSVSEFIDANSQAVTAVQSPKAAELRLLLEGIGAIVELDSSGGWRVTGPDRTAIGDLALASGIALHELRSVRSSLEDVYTRLTEASVEYRAGAGRVRAKSPDRPRITRSQCDERSDRCRHDITNDGRARGGPRRLSGGGLVGVDQVPNSALHAGVSRCARGGLPGVAVIVAATESLQPDDTILGASLLGGAVLAQVLAAALGATLVTGEYRSGMFRVTLTACPRRLVVLAAKAAVTAGVVVAVTLPSGLAAFGLGVAMLDGDATRSATHSLLCLALCWRWR